MLLSNMLDKKKLINVSERKREREETEYSFMLLIKLQTKKKKLNVNILRLKLFYFQKQWEEGLQAMDQAINDMPRTKHRLYVHV